jgi:hypothetical protein
MPGALPHRELLDRNSPLLTPRTPIQPYAATFGLLAALQERTTLDPSTITGAVLTAQVDQRRQRSCG